MLEQLLKLYTMYMATLVTSPTPHFIGPPGAGKSTVARTLADLVGKRLHILNVSRINPLEVEGVQMPDVEHTKLNHLLATFWAELEEGDIVLLDEFLRGFPEVYNALLDILTSREVAGHPLPNVFVMAASNSSVTYDGALEDRLLHIPVPDPRNNKGEKKRLGKMLLDEIGLMPEMADSIELNSVLDIEVLPTFDILDTFKGRGNQVGATTSTIKGSSIRKLAGQARLRFIESVELATLIEANNSKAATAKKFQYIVLMSGKRVPDSWVQGMTAIAGSKKLTPLQRTNLDLNIQLIEMEKQIDSQREDKEDDDFLDDDYDA